MKRFRFPLETALALRTRKLEALEAVLADVGARRQAALRQAIDLERKSAAVRETIAGAGPLRGSDVRLADAASQGLLLQAKTSRDVARRLDREVVKAREDVVRARREVETLERLRERSVLEWRRASDREEETLAAELFLARFRRG